MVRPGVREISPVSIRNTYLPRSFSTLSELSEDSDEKLFFLARYNPNHILHRLFPQPKTVHYNLRKCTHNLTLPTYVSAVIKQNFVYRMLFCDILVTMFKFYCFVTEFA